MVNLYSVIPLDLNNFFLRVCLVGMKIGRMKNRDRKIEWKMIWKQVFSLSLSLSPPPSKYNLSKLERILEWKVGKTFGQNCPHLFNVLASFIYFSFIYFYYFSFVTPDFLFFLSLVLSGGGFFFFSFFFLLNFYFYYFFKITLLNNFLCYFWNVHFHLYTIFFFFFLR